MSNARPKVIWWWLEPKAVAGKYNGGFANSVSAARDAASNFINLQNRETFGKRGISFRFKELEVTRKYHVMKAMNDLASEIYQDGYETRKAFESKSYKWGEF